VVERRVNYNAADLIKSEWRTAKPSWRCRSRNLQAGALVRSQLLNATRTDANGRRRRAKPAEQKRSRRQQQFGGTIGQYSLWESYLQLRSQNPEGARRVAGTENHYRYARTDSVLLFRTTTRRGGGFPNVLFAPSFRLQEEPYFKSRRKLRPPSPRINAESLRRNPGGSNNALRSCFQTANHANNEKSSAKEEVASLP